MYDFKIFQTVTGYIQGTNFVLQAHIEQGIDKTKHKIKSKIFYDCKTDLSSQLDSDI